MISIGPGRILGETGPGLVFRGLALHWRGPGRKRVPGRSLRTFEGVDYGRK